MYFDCITSPKVEALCPKSAILCILTLRKSPRPAPLPARLGQARPGPLLWYRGALSVPHVWPWEDVHGAGASQGTDGDLLRHTKGCIINISTFLYLHFFLLCYLPTYLPACFWQVPTLCSGYSIYVLPQFGYFGFLLLFFSQQALTLTLTRSDLCFDPSLSSHLFRTAIIILIYGLLLLTNGP